MHGVHHAHRLLQCLTVATRPLRVEFAELLAYDFDSVEEGILKVDPNWRWKDHEEAVLSTCSSLIAVVNDGGFQVVQFSYFSVQEFLTSDRLATLGEDAAHDHISPGVAHILLAQVCLGTLLSLEGGESNSADGDGNSFPLARYAAQHWIAHSQVDKTLSRLYDVEDQNWTRRSDRIMERMATPLYYAALCGFHGLVEHLLVKYPGRVNALGSGRGAALHGASSRNYIEVAQRHLEMGRFLLDHGADVHSRQYNLWTSLHHATWIEYVDISQILLENKADVNSRDNRGRVPLHSVSENSYEKGDFPSVARLLLEHGADVDVKDNEDATPLHVASSRGKTEIVRLLLDHGANADAKDKRGRAPFQTALASRRDEIAQMLTEHGVQLHEEQ
ncbi:ankyrin repeat-containing domain protein [Lactarius vividus]|nr:ankyrin repeat-containing domain protein [Lactarius vividus]